MSHAKFIVVLTMSLQSCLTDYCLKQASSISVL